MVYARLKDLDFYLIHAKYRFQIKIIETDIAFGLAAF